MQNQHKAVHDRLRVMIDDYVGMLRPGERPDMAEIMKRRFAFAAAFREHVASEGPAFERLRTGDPAHRIDRLIDQHGCRLREVVPGYNALIRDWTPQRIAADWATYCREVKAQVYRYCAFLAWEDAEILPLLDRPSASYRATSSG